MSDQATPAPDNEVRLQGDIGEVIRVVLLVKNEQVFLQNRAQQGTVTPDDLTGLETALGELKNLHPDVADAVDNTTAGVATIGTDPTAGPTAPTVPDASNPGPGPDVPSNIGNPVPGPTDGDPIDNSNNTVTPPATGETVVDAPGSAPAEGAAPDTV